ncbi:MAG TPA: ISAs1 family transposase [Pseudonocardiaceae bacterium]|nr:ISAs1 family transposase [Pseudonocardiaceae bacterium]
MLGEVADRRSPRGRIYGLVFVLAAALVAVLAGAKNFQEITGQVADLPQSLLPKLGGRWCSSRGMFRVPSKDTIRRVLTNIDAAALDLAVGAWLQQRVSRDSDGLVRIAIDGKVLRGAWTDQNDRFTLFSAMVHRQGVTLAQVHVPADTNEITQVTALLDSVSAPDGVRVVVTMDAAHTQRDTAEYLAGQRRFDYVATCKGNQPTLRQAVFDKVAPLIRTPPGHLVKERGHGRINHWSTWITDAEGIDFPHARQTACIRREVFDLHGQRLSKDYAWIITSATPEHAQACDLHDYVRDHWGIENKSHHVRDTTWREDAHQAHTGSGPQVMATLRNLAAALLRLNGHHTIKSATEAICRDRTRALPLLATKATKPLPNVTLI